MPCSYPSIKTPTDLRTLNSVLSSIAKDVCYLLSSSGGSGVTSVSGTANRISVTGTTTPAVDIDAAYVGQTSITTLGTISTGTWSGTAISVAKGGTGQTTYTNGQLLIGNTTGNTLAKGTLTQPAAGVTITGGAGTITFALANDLSALEGLSTNGIAARTASDTWTTRTVTGTASRVSVTNGDGVSGNPTLDIDSAYVGQTSITTLGTITTGTWNGTGITSGNLSYGANTILVNNTAGTAAPTAVTYKAVSRTTYAGTATWDGTPPGTLSNQTYEWYQINKQVTLRISMTYNVAGTTNTQVTLTLPSGAPTPEVPAGFAFANTNIYWGTGGMASANTALITNNSKVVLGNDASQNPLITVSGTSLSAKVVNITITYTAQ